MSTNRFQKWIFQRQKQPVEKPVESVENSILTTFFSFLPQPSPQENVGAFLPNKLKTGCKTHELCRHLQQFQKPGIFRKMLAFSPKPPPNRLIAALCVKNFCIICTNAHFCMIPAKPEILLTYPPLCTDSGAVFHNQVQMLYTGGSHAG